ALRHFAPHHPAPVTTVVGTVALDVGEQLVAGRRLRTEIVHQFVLAGARVHLPELHAAHVVEARGRIVAIVPADFVDLADAGQPAHDLAGGQVLDPGAGAVLAVDDDQAVVDADRRVARVDHQAAGGHTADPCAGRGIHAHLAQRRELAVLGLEQRAVAQEGEASVAFRGNGRGPRYGGR